MYSAKIEGVTITYLVEAVVDQQIVFSLGKEVEITYDETDQIGRVFSTERLAEITGKSEVIIYFSCGLHAIVNCKRELDGSGKRAEAIAKILFRSHRFSDTADLC
jgi:hypothetical protein